MPRRYLPPPDKHGFRRSIGADPNARHYRLRLSDGRSIHILEYEDRYCIHWDLRDPDEDPIGHLLLDTPFIEGVIEGGFLSAVLELFFDEKPTLRRMLLASAVGAAILGILKLIASAHSASENLALRDHAIRVGNLELRPRIL